jgi:hypothetical protein
MDLATGLTRALLRLGIPIVGVSIGRADDPTTWRIDYLDSATEAQRADGEALKLSYSLATDTAARDEDMDAWMADKKLRAVVLWVAQHLSVTPATARAEIIAIYRNL